MNLSSRRCRAAIADHADLVLYDFGPSHPLRPERIVAGLGLLEAAGLWSRETETIVPVSSPLEDLHTVHDPQYVRAVDEAGTGLLPGGMLRGFGFTHTDNPPFPSMHHAASLVSGATVQAARLVMAGELDHAFSPAGGLHHALRARAAGFCIYNDPAVAAAVLVRDYDARVLYVDFDCHHGDGVQWLFYDDPRVMTISFHESGRFLFPGTGDPAETGEGPGRGYSVNVPFAPFTRDNQWLTAVRAVLPPLVQRFAPDIIVSNHGCDTHFWDPITHLSLSTTSFAEQARLVHELAHEYCGGRLLSVGSGGYDWRRVVPRSWSILWAELTGRTLPGTLPAEWAARWDTSPEEPMPTRFLDDETLASESPEHPEIAQANQETLRLVTRVAGLA